jgi:hypothetical protein
VTLRQKVYATEDNNAFIMLLTLVGDSFTLRASDWSEDVVSLGKTYRAQPFKGTLASAGDDAPPRAAVRIDNVNLLFMTAIRSVTNNPLTATITIVSSMFPDITDLGPYEFACRLGKYDGTSAELDLAYEDILNAAVPHHVCSPAITPALFR